MVFFRSQNYCLLIILIMILQIVACSTQPLKQSNHNFLLTQQPLPQITQWEIERATIIIKTANKKQKLYLHWLHDEEQEVLRLFNSLGITYLHAQQQAEQATIVTYDGDTYTGDNLEQVIYEQTRMALPISALSTLILGQKITEIENIQLLPVANQEEVGVEFLDQRQQTWQLFYTESQLIPEHNIFLPKKIRLEHQHLQIKLIIYQWNLSFADN